MTESGFDQGAADAARRAERVLSAGEVERVVKRRVEEKLGGPGGLELSGLCVEGVLGETKDLRRYGKTVYGASVSDDSGGARLDLAVPSHLEEDLQELEFRRVRARGDLEVRPFKSAFRFQLNVRGLEPVEDPSAEGRRADKSLAGVLKGYRRRARPFPPTSPDAPARVLVLHPSTGVALRDFAEGLGGAAVAAEAVPVATNDPAAMTRAVRGAACDVLVLTRGGGPSEDLLPFDDPELAEAWMGHPAYTISAVGHARDAAVIDALSDAACPTPTAAGAFVGAKAAEAAQASAMARAAAEADAALREAAAARKTVLVLGAGCALLLVLLVLAVAR